MTRKEKIETLISHSIDSLTADPQRLDAFLRECLENHLPGYAQMSGEEIESEYQDLNS